MATEQTEEAGKGRRGRRTRGRGITVTTVAKEAGVSRAAVSFAYNMPEQLSVETRERILAVAARLGYSPDPVARMLTTRHAGAVGLLMVEPIESAFADPFTATFVRGMGQMCDRHGLALTLLPPRLGSVTAAAQTAVVDGVIMLGLAADNPGLAALEQRGLPLVLVDSLPHGQWPSVQVDDEVGAYAAARHLVDLGHRHIAILSFTTDPTNPAEEGHGQFYVPRQRLAGYQRAFTSAPEPMQVARYDVSSNLVSGERMMYAILDRTDLPRPTAVLTMSDAMALGAMRACQERGLRVPQDISVVGFDDIPEAATATPALTTVAQPIFDKATLAMRMLLSQIERDGEGEALLAPQHVVLPTHLAIRASSAPPR
ncbi:MAG: LacI family DNA-binding transcriptional regulator [Ktedonobacterales bacterium]|nr:LacI family DNA-binding transcriptional regulator [Ktedonobacterales bacterium]